MASAACPQCHILLIEADEPTVADLAAAVDTSVTLGATEVSSRKGSTEFCLGAAEVPNPAGRQ